MSGGLEEKLVFSDGQYLAILISQCFCAGLSIACSSLIIFVAIKRLNQKTNFPVQQRLLLLLGTLDILFSGGVAAGHFLSPKGQTPTSIGTIQICSIQGAFVATGSQGTQLCNMFLSLYYYLTVRYGRTTKDLKCWEYTWFSTILGYPMLLVSAALYQKNFGVWEGAEGCFLGGAYPMGCDLDPVVECQRGGGEHRFLLWGISLCSFTVSTSGCFLFTFLVWFVCRKLIRQSSRYNFAGATANQNHHLIREVTRQTILYSSVYFNMVLWVGTIQFINPIVFASDAPLMVKFLLHLVANSFMVLSGVFNCAAYMRPSYNRWRNARPNLSPWVVLRSAVESEDPPRSTVCYNTPTRDSTESTKDRPTESDNTFIGSSRSCVRQNDGTSGDTLQLSATEHATGSHIGTGTGGDTNQYSSTGTG